MDPEAYPGMEYLKCALLANSTKLEMPTRKTLDYWTHL